MVSPKPMLSSVARRSRSSQVLECVVDRGREVMSSEVPRGVAVTAGTG